MERGLRRKAPIIDDTIIEENFCYWQEDAPDYMQLNHLIGIKKICLLRQMEYKLDKEAAINKAYFEEEPFPLNKVNYQ